MTLVHMTIHGLRPRPGLQRKKNREYVRECMVQGIFFDERFMDNPRRFGRRWRG
jgi:hypothetical protein